MLFTEKFTVLADYLNHIGVVDWVRRWSASESRAMESLFRRIYCIRHASEQGRIEGSGNKPAISRGTFWSWIRLSIYKNIDTLEWPWGRIYWKWDRSGKYRDGESGYRSLKIRVHQIFLSWYSLLETSNIGCYIRFEILWRGQVCLFFSHQ